MRCGRSKFAPVLGGLALFGYSSVAVAAVVWVGDLETGDTSQFNFVLNGNVDGTDYITIVQDEVAQGDNSARIELHNDAVWPNGLKRVELQHRPDDARTAEGATSYFAWSFFLPDALPEDPSQTIGYWESTNSFQQVMAFTVAGDTMRFATRRPNNAVHWDETGVVTAGQWHRIAMRVLWSTDENLGEVDVWFDGELVVDAAGAQTLADNNPHFVQFGLLRSAIEFQDVPVIYIDDAVEGDSLEDVRFDELPGEDPGGTGGSTGTSGPDGTSTSDGATSSSTSTSGDGSTTSGTQSTSSSTGSDDSGTGETDTAGAENESTDDGCGCRGGHEATPRWTWALLGLLGLSRRRA